MLPGGFQLPLALILEQYICYEQTDIAADSGETDAYALLDAYVSKQMLMGRMLASHYLRHCSEAGNYVRGIYICEEMIGKLRKEELEIKNGK